MKKARSACIAGNLARVQQHFSTEVRMVAACGLFSTSCEHGHLHIAQWLLHVEPNINVSAEDEWAFRAACKHGHLHIAQWLLQVKPDINVSAEDKWAFRAACKYGYLQIAQWLLQIKPDINVSAEDEWAFCVVCDYGHLDVAQWLLQVKPSINVSVFNERAFRRACIRGHLHVAKWLLHTKPDIDISACSEEVFRSACIDRQWTTVKWFSKLNPSRYLCVRNEQGVVVGGKIVMPPFLLSILLPKTEDSDPPQNIECCICYGTEADSTGSFVQTPCSHVFCYDCAAQYFTSSRKPCAYCRQPVEHVIRL